MRRVLPILFNTEDVRATLAGRKTVKRFPVKYKYNNTEMKMRTDKYRTRLIEIQKDVEGETFGKNPDGSTWRKLRGYIEPKPPYRIGDLLYVRETFDCIPGSVVGDPGNEKCYFYRADGDHRPISWRGKWQPSIHMPKEAARIWLRVTDVWVERLQDMEPVDVIKEGAYPDCWDCLNAYGESGSQCCYGTEDECRQCDGVMMEWKKLWDSTIKKTDIDRYGWDASPWVWVIEYVMCEKPD